MQKVLLQSTQAAEIKVAAAEAKADAVAATTLENPSLVFDTTAQHNNASDTWSLELEQPLKWSQFGAAQNYAQLIESTANLEQKSKLLELRHSILLAYVDCWLKQEQGQLLQEQLNFVQQQQAAIEEAESQGQLNQLEIRMLELSFARLQEQLRIVILQTQTQKRVLLQTAGLPQQDFIAAKLSLKALPSLAELTKDLNQEAGAKSLLAKRAQLAQSRYTVAKQDASFPEIAPRAIYEKDEDTDSSTFLLGLSITLPIWNRNQEELLRAQAELDLTQTALKQIELGSWDAALRYSYKQAQEWRDSSGNYQQNILKQWESISALIADKFDNGQLAISDLANYQAQEVELKSEALEIYAKAIESTVLLETITGKAL